MSSAEASGTIGWGGSCTAAPNRRPRGWQYNCHPNETHPITIDGTLGRQEQPTASVAKSGVVAIQQTESYPDFAYIVNRWPSLPYAVVGG